MTSVSLSSGCRWWRNNPPHPAIPQGTARGSSAALASWFDSLLGGGWPKAELATSPFLGLTHLQVSSSFWDLLVAISSRAAFAFSRQLHRSALPGLRRALGLGSKYFSSSAGTAACVREALLPWQPSSPTARGLALTAALRSSLFAADDKGLLISRVTGKRISGGISEGPSDIS